MVLLHAAAVAVAVLLAIFVLGVLHAFVYGPSDNDSDMLTTERFVQYRADGAAESRDIVFNCLGSNPDHLGIELPAAVHYDRRPHYGRRAHYGIANLWPTSDQAEGPAGFDLSINTKTVSEIEATFPFAADGSHRLVPDGRDFAWWKKQVSGDWGPTQWRLKEKEAGGPGRVSRFLRR